MSAERIELSTNGLKGHCSTIELRAHTDTYFNTVSRPRQQAQNKWYSWGVLKECRQNEMEKNKSKQWIISDLDNIIFQPPSGFAKTCFIGLQNIEIRSCLHSSMQSFPNANSNVYFQNHPLFPLFPKSLLLWPVFSNQLKSLKSDQVHLLSF